MDTISTIRKAIAQLLAGVLTWATAVVVSEPARITASEWVVLAGVGVGAFMVWLVPNAPQLPPRDSSGRFRGTRGQVNIIGIVVLIILLLIILRIFRIV